MPTIKDTNAVLEAAEVLVAACRQAWPQTDTKGIERAANNAVALSLDNDEKEQPQKAVR